MAGGIPISAKFDVAIAEPLDGKTESVATFTDLANTPFPFKGMQKLVEDEGVRGVLYYLGNDFTTWTKVGNEDALTQGTNTLTEDLIISGANKSISFDLSPDSNISVQNTFDLSGLNINLDYTPVNVLTESYIGLSFNHKTTWNNDKSSQILVETQSNTRILLENKSNGLLDAVSIELYEDIKLKNEKGLGISFEDRTVDEANVDFSTDDNNLLSIGKAKENLLQQGTNTLTEDLELVRTGSTKTSTFELDDRYFALTTLDQSTGNYGEVYADDKEVYLSLLVGVLENKLDIDYLDGIVFKSEILGNGISFNDRAIDEANVDFSTDDNNLLSIGKAKENLLQQGDNTLTEELGFDYTGNNGTIKEEYSDSLVTSKNIDVEDNSGNKTTYKQRTDVFQIKAEGVDGYGIDYEHILRVGKDGAYFGIIEGITNEFNASSNGLYFFTEQHPTVQLAKSLIGTSQHGNGFQYASRALDLANVVWGGADYLSVIPPMDMIIDNTQQKHTVTDYTDAFTIPNGTNNATLTMTNAVNKDVTISTTSFANVGDACELSSLLGVGYPIVVAGTGVALVDPNSVASDSFNIKGLRRMNDVSGVIQIQLY